MNKISAVIIAFNEEKNINRCINSLKPVADEIIVIDSFSNDLTRECAREAGAKVIEQKFLGHIEQKNFALDQATYDFVLSLDADEVLSEELSQTILFHKNDLQADAYQCHRLNKFCGKWIRHGSWYPDKKIRLWNKKKGRWGGRNPHDKVIMQPGSKILWIPGDLLHYTVDTMDGYIGQINKFSSIQASQLIIEKCRPNFFHLYFKPFYKFIHAYLFRLGFLDGWRGFAIAYGQALGVYLRYLKVKSSTNNVI